MENFAIDLDAVLDEFELREDRTESSALKRGNLAGQSLPCTAAGTAATTVTATSAVAPPTAAVAPPTAAVAPPTAVVAPPAAVVAPPTFGVATPTFVDAPPSSMSGSPISAIGRPISPTGFTSKVSVQQLLSEDRPTGSPDSLARQARPSDVALSDSVSDSRLADQAETGWCDPDANTATAAAGAAADAHSVLPNRPVAVVEFGNTVVATAATATISSGQLPAHHSASSVSPTDQLTSAADYCYVSVTHAADAAEGAPVSQPDRAATDATDATDAAESAPDVAATDACQWEASDNQASPGTVPEQLSSNDNSDMCTVGGVNSAVLSDVLSSDSDSDGGSDGGGHQTALPDHQTPSCIAAAAAAAGSSVSSASNAGAPVTAVSPTAGGALYSDLSWHTASTHCDNIPAGDCAPVESNTAQVALFASQKVATTVVTVASNDNQQTTEKFTEMAAVAEADDQQTTGGVVAEAGDQQTTGGVVAVAVADDEQMTGQVVAVMAEADTLASSPGASSESLSSSSIYQIAYTCHDEEADDTPRDAESSAPAAAATDDSCVDSSSVLSAEPDSSALATDSGGNGATDHTQPPHTNCWSHQSSSADGEASAAAAVSATVPLSTATATADAPTICVTCPAIAPGNPVAAAADAVSAAPSAVAGNPAAAAAADAAPIFGNTAAAAVAASCTTATLADHSAADYCGPSATANSGVTTERVSAPATPPRPDSLDVTPHHSAHCPDVLSPAVTSTVSLTTPAVTESVVASTSAVAAVAAAAGTTAVNNAGSTESGRRSSSNIVTAPCALAGAGAPAGAASRAVPPRGRLTSSSTDDASLGRVAPVWVPDSESERCMACECRFTVVRRRHHCRACGRVLCASCCDERARLEFMEMRLARVCLRCKEVLDRVQKSVNQSCDSLLAGATQDAAASSSSAATAAAAAAGASPHPPHHGRPPNPNNPLEYCSTVPPLEQAGAMVPHSPPSVLVPTSVLRRPEEPGTPRTAGATKQVIFSDGIRPGGDLTELPGNSVSTLSRRASRPHAARRDGASGRDDGADGAANSPQNSWYRLTDQLPPIVKTTAQLSSDASGRVIGSSLSCQQAADLILDHHHHQQQHQQQQQGEQQQQQGEQGQGEGSSVRWSFQINNNLLVHTSLVKLECCVGSVCWVFLSSGLRAVGQDEVLLVLQCANSADSDNSDVQEPLPRDVFVHYRRLYTDALEGRFVCDLGHTLVTADSFLGSREHAGFLYVRPTLQCLHALPVAPPPYLVALLIHKWEVPWAKVLPLRLLLRLGAEFRYYPCPVVSVRGRKPVFFEIGQTIISLLADFRNYTYALPCISGMYIHMEEKKTTVLLSRNHFNKVLLTMANSDEHVLALAACFSLRADSHLVCVQSEQGRYQTQAINIHSRPRQITGASFVVFNGALKSSLGLTAKSSIVEDGLMYQISPDAMVSLRDRLGRMEDVQVECGPVSGPVQETLSICWVADSPDCNVGVTSVIDGRAMDGVMSKRVHQSAEYSHHGKLIRCSEVFFLKGEDPSKSSRFAGSLMKATFAALLPFLSQLYDTDLSPLALRASVDSDMVCYEAGSCGHQLPAELMKALDAKLVPLMHHCVSRDTSQSCCLELVFYVLRC